MYAQLCRNARCVDVTVQTSNSLLTAARPTEHVKLASTMRPLSLVEVTFHGPLSPGLMEGGHARAGREPAGHVCTCVQVTHRVHRRHNQWSQLGSQAVTGLQTAWCGLALCVAASRGLAIACERPRSRAMHSAMGNAGLV